MDLKLCDMCGKRITERYELSKTKFHTIRTVLGIDLSSYEEYDLCIGCAIKVRAYIKRNITFRLKDSITEATDVKE